MLMCGPCWSKVPTDLQREVYRTVKLRDPKSVDETWAPWWRAQARAIHYVGMLSDAASGRPPDPRGAKYLAREMAFADDLEARPREARP